MKTEDITYRDNAVSLSGFVAYDEKRIANETRLPGILIVHEAWGLGEHVIMRAKMLADLGYVGFAADMFGDRRTTTSREEALALIGEMRGNPPKLRARARIALDAMAALPYVDGTRLAAIGFCFGGSTALELARDGATLSGVVSFHGALETKAPAKPGEVKPKVLVCHGADDPMIPPPHVVAFEDEMRKAGANWQVNSYGGTVHGFMNPKNDGSIAPGILYNAQSDARAWAAMQAFFAEIFAR